MEKEKVRQTEKELKTDHQPVRQVNGEPTSRMTTSADLPTW